VSRGNPLRSRSTSRTPRCTLQSLRGGVRPDCTPSGPVYQRQRTRNLDSPVPYWLLDKPYPGALKAKQNRRDHDRVSCAPHATAIFRAQYMIQQGRGDESMGCVRTVAHSGLP
jgi:hypothetical protein